MLQESKKDFFLPNFFVLVQSAKEGRKSDQDRASAKWTALLFPLFLFRTFVLIKIYLLSFHFFGPANRFPFRLVFSFSEPKMGHYPSSIVRKISRTKNTFFALFLGLVNQSIFPPPPVFHDEVMQQHGQSLKVCQTLFAGLIEYLSGEQNTSENSMPHCPPIFASNISYKITKFSTEKRQHHFCSQLYFSLSPHQCTDGLVVLKEATSIFFAMQAQSALVNFLLAKLRFVHRKKLLLD